MSLENNPNPPVSNVPKNLADITEKTSRFERISHKVEKSMIKVTNAIKEIVQPSPKLRPISTSIPIPPNLMDEAEKSKLPKFVQNIISRTKAKKEEKDEPTMTIPRYGSAGPGWVGTKFNALIGELHRVESRFKRALKNDDLEGLKTELKWLEKTKIKINDIKHELEKEGFYKQFEDIEKSYETIKSALESKITKLSPETENKVKEKTILSYTQKNQIVFNLNLIRNLEENKKIGISDEGELVGKDWHGDGASIESQNAMRELLDIIEISFKSELAEIPVISEKKMGNEKIALSELIGKLKRSDWCSAVFNIHPKFKARLDQLEKQTIQMETSTILKKLENTPKIKDPNLDFLLKISNTRGGDRQVLAQNGIIPLKNFLLTYTNVMSSEELIKSLHTLLSDNKIPNSNKLDLMDFAITWAKSGLYTEDYKENNEVKKQFNEIDKYISNLPLSSENIDLKTKNNQLKESLKKLEETSIRPFYSTSPPLEAGENFMKKISQEIKDNALSEKEFASQLRAVFGESHSKIGGLEFLHYNPKPGKSKSPNLKQHIDKTTNLSNMVTKVIVSEPNLEARKKIYQFFVKAADICHKDSNFDGAMAIYAGLNQSPVNRLTKTKEDSAKTLSELDQKLSSFSNYKNLRSTQDEVIDKGGIPYIGMYITDLTFIQDGNPNTKDGRININKLNLLADVIEKENQVRTYFKNHPDNSHSELEDALKAIQFDINVEHKKSMSIEPKK